MGSSIIAAVGVMMLLEGLPLLLAPEQWRRYVNYILTLAPGQLRFIGLAMLLLAVVLVQGSGMLKVLALVLIFEGLMPALVPEQLQRVYAGNQAIEEVHLRRIGGVAAGLGMVILLFL
ncbi:MAG: hypothetical protein CSB44_05545 [Gammaproteobacteria bacterium]|nr:MAG: hypothetical protein CSB44_05545 [Gammaproteobacteria bacterium]